MQRIRGIIKNIFEYITVHPLASFVTVLSLLTSLIAMVVIYKISGAFINLILLFVE